MLKGRGKVLLEGNPPQSWPWKQNGTTVVAVAIFLIKKRVRDKYFEKSDFKPESSLLQEKYITFTIVDWLVTPIK